MCCCENKIARKLIWWPVVAKHTPGTSPTNEISMKMIIVIYGLKRNDQITLKLTISHSMRKTLHWRHNGGDCVANHQPCDCLLNRLFIRKSKKTSNLRVIGLGEGNSPGTGEFPAQMASNAENVSIWWSHHDLIVVRSIWGKMSANKFDAMTFGPNFISEMGTWGPFTLTLYVLIF